LQLDALAMTKNLIAHIHNTVLAALTPLSARMFCYPSSRHSRTDSGMALMNVILPTQAEPKHLI
jgi:hypothetical protein